MSAARQSIYELVDQARGRLTRLSPAQALQAQQAGAALVDIRPHASRELEGELPGAVVIERTVLEWRLDPAGDARLPIASYDLLVVVVCNEGYSSNLAAANTPRPRHPPRHRPRRRLPRLEGRPPPNSVAAVRLCVCLCSRTSDDAAVLCEPSCGSVPARDRFGY